LGTAHILGQMNRVGAKVRQRQEDD